MLTSKTGRHEASDHCPDAIWPLRVGAVAVLLMQRHALIIRQQRCPRAQVMFALQRRGLGLCVEDEVIIHRVMPTFLWSDTQIFSGMYHNAVQLQSLKQARPLLCIGVSCSRGRQEACEVKSSTCMIPGIWKKHWPFHITWDGGRYGCKHRWHQGTRTAWHCRTATEKRGRGQLNLTKQGRSI